MLKAKDSKPSCVAQQSFKSWASCKPSGRSHRQLFAKAAGSELLPSKEETSVDGNYRHGVLSKLQQFQSQQVWRVAWNITGTLLTAAEEDLVHYFVENEEGCWTEQALTEMNPS